MKPPPCPGGYFLVDGEPLVSSGLGAPDAVVVEGRSLALLSGCGPTVAKLKGTRRGTKITAKWSSCAGIRGRVKLRAVIDPNCTSMAGKVRARGLKRRFSARLFSGFGFCGDGRLDPGEDCDPPDAAAGCDAFCLRSPVCGDGIQDGFEACDDGGTVSCDGCAADCSRRDAVCGDGIVECGETCDGASGCGPGERCTDACGCEPEESCSAASACGDRQYCGADQRCLCLRSAEGPIRCGRIPDTCDVQLCQTSADCAILGEGYFCDTPNSGCCSDPPQELPRCIAPCTPPALPSCSERTYTDTEIDAAVATAMAGVADPWGEGLGAVFSRTAAALGCDLALPRAQASESPTVSPNLTAADCSTGYCSNVRYCGRGNSESNPSFPFPSNSDCLNRACFEHDNCYTEECIANDCLWSPQSTACDRPFFDSCSACNPVNEFGLRPHTRDAITCAIAKQMSRRTPDAPCQQPPPECVGCEVCEDGACVDSTPVGYRTCETEDGGAECCQGPCAPEGGCCSAFRFCQNATICCPLGQSCISPTDRAPFCCSALQSCQDGGFGEKKVCCEEEESCRCTLAGCGCAP